MKDKDMVNVVRCKNCINGTIHKKVGNGIMEPPYVHEVHCSLLGVAMGTDAFCSYSEAKETDKDIEHRLNSIDNLEEISEGHGRD